MRRLFESIVRAVTPLAQRLQVPPDKLAHFLVGFGVSLVVSTWTRNGLVGAVVVLALAVAKEFWDSRGNGTVEQGDLNWTVIGGIAASVLETLVRL